MRRLLIVRTATNVLKLHPLLQSSALSRHVIDAAPYRAENGLSERLAHRWNSRLVDVPPRATARGRNCATHLCPDRPVTTCTRKLSRISAEPKRFTVAQSMLGTGVGRRAAAEVGRPSRRCHVRAPPQTGGSSTLETRGVRTGCGPPSEKKGTGVESLPPSSRLAPVPDRHCV